MRKVKPEDFNLFVKLPDLYLYLDPKLNILNASDAYLIATYTKRENIIGRNIFEVFPDNPELKDGDGVSNLAASLDFVLINKKEHEMAIQRYDVPLPNGAFEFKYWKPLNIPVLDEEGEILFIVHKVEDVTESFKDKKRIVSLDYEKGQKEAKEKQDLIASEAQRKIIHDMSQESPFPMGIFKGPEYVIITANPSMCEVWRKRPEDVIGLPLFEAFPELIHQGFKELLDGVFKTGIPFIGKEIPAEVPTEEGTQTYYYDLIYHANTESDGSISGITVIASDVTSIVKANAATRESKERFQQLLQNLPEITWTALPSGEVTFFNKKWYEFSGLSFEESLTFGWKNVIHPDDIEDNLKIFNRSIETGNPGEAEQRLKEGNDGDYKWHLVRFSPLKNAKGEIGLWVGTTVNIHALKTAEKELNELRNREKSLLEESEKERKRLYSLFMDAPAMVVVFKAPNHIFELVNPLYQKLYGDRQLLGLSVREALPELEGQGVYELLDEVYQSGVPFIGKEIPLLIAGEEEQKYFNLIYKPKYGVDSAINGIIGFGYEVTDQVLARKNLEKSERTLRIAQEAGNIGTFEWNLHTNAIKFTPQIEIIFGYTPGTWKGNYDNALKTIHPDDVERIQKENEEAIENRKNLNIEHRIIRPNGEERWINSKGEIFSDENGKPKKVVGVIIDITDRKEAEQALKKKNKELSHMNTDLDNFIYTASHDLKAPISNLEGLLNAFAEDEKFNPEQKGLIEMMAQSINRFKTTINDLTEISKVQRGGPEEDFDTLTIPEIWNEVKLDIVDLINRFNPEIITEFHASEIKYSRKNLRSIIYNIVSNALKYSSSERRPVVRIVTERRDDCFILKVIDNGLGLTQENQRKVFGMFKRAHQHVEGTGIGLYVIKRMIENTGGKIEIESELGKGATFIVQFKEC